MSRVECRYTYRGVRMVTNRMMTRIRIRVKD